MVCQGFDDCSGLESIFKVPVRKKKNDNMTEYVTSLKTFPLTPDIIRYNNSLLVIILNLF